MQEPREHTPERLVSAEAIARAQELDADFARRMGLDAVPPSAERPAVRARRSRRRPSPPRHAERPW
jgi:hypothetical protein